MPLDDCFYALQATIPHLTRSALHWLLQRHSISRLPNTQGVQIAAAVQGLSGRVHMDLAEVWTEEGKLYLFVAIDRVSKFAFAAFARPSDEMDPGGLSAPATGCL